MSTESGTTGTAPAPDGPPGDVAALLAPMVKRRLWVAINRKAGTDAQIEPHMVAHLRYMIDLEQRGLLWASGPFLQPGVLVGDGLTILSTATEGEARELLVAEPLTQLGLRTFEGPHLWELREGRLPISLDASSSRFSLH